MKLKLFPLAFDGVRIARMPPSTLGANVSVQVPPGGQLPTAVALLLNFGWKRSTRSGVPHPAVPTVRASTEAMQLPFTWGFERKA